MLPNHQDIANSNGEAGGENWRADGLLLVGHGTREAAGVAEFLAVAEQARRISPLILEPCFLELARPTIAEGVGRLIERGARRITVVPVLLFAAGHAKRDIPTAVAEARGEFPQVSVRYARPLECHAQVLALSARRYQEALEQTSVQVLEGSPVNPRETLLIMVGRGSSDPSATAEMQRFSKLRRELTPVGDLETCFVARQEPLLAEALPLAVAAGFRRIVVQPHLLFKGQLLDDIRHEIERTSGCQLPQGLPAAVCSISASAGSAGELRNSSAVSETIQQWIVAAPLGPEPEIARAVLDLAAAVEVPAISRSDGHTGLMASQTIVAP